MGSSSKSGAPPFRISCLNVSSSEAFFARASLEELLLDYHDFLRQRELKLWHKNDVNTQKNRRLAFEQNRSYRTYKTYIEAAPEIAANTLICLIHQTNFLLDQLLKQLEQAFLKEGGFTEKLYKARQFYRKNTFQK